MNDKSELLNTGRKTTIQEMRLHKGITSLNTNLKKQSSINPKLIEDRRSILKPQIVKKLIPEMPANSPQKMPVSPSGQPHEEQFKTLRPSALFSRSSSRLISEVLTPTRARNRSQNRLSPQRLKPPLLSPSPKLNLEEIQGLAFQRPNQSIIEDEYIDSLGEAIQFDSRRTESEEAVIQEQLIAKRTCAQRLLFNKQDRFRILWEIFILVIALWNSSVLPVLVSFPILLKNSHFGPINSALMNVIFFLDMVINLRTTFTNKSSKIITNQKEIAIKYAKSGRLLFDLIAWIPYEQFVYSIDGISHGWLLLDLSKMTRLFFLKRLIGNTALQTPIIKFVIVISQYTFILLFTLHLTGCLWAYIISMNEIWVPSLVMDNEDNFVFDKEQMLTSYFVSFYYGCLAMFGNDILPQASYETIVSAMITFIGSIFIGLLIGEFSSLLMKLNGRENYEIEKKNFMNVVIKDIKLPFDFKARIFDYNERVSKQYKVQNSAFITQTLFYQGLNDNNTEKIQYFQSEKLIRDGELFENDINQIFQFLTLVRIAIFLEGDVIIKQGDVADKFYFVNEGLVEVIQEKVDFMFFDFKKSQTFLTSQATGYQNQIEDDPELYRKSLLGQNARGFADLIQQIVQKNRHEKMQRKSHILQKIKTTRPELGKRKQSMVAAQLPRRKSDAVNFLQPKRFSIMKKESINKLFQNSPAQLILKPQKTQKPDYKKKITVNQQPSSTMIDHHKSLFTQKENKNYKVINELGEGQFFGEIALVTALPRTSTVIASIGTATCGYINKYDFDNLIKTNQGIKEKLDNKIMRYNDDFFKTREWMFRSIFDFRKLRKDHLRKFTLKMEEQFFNDGDIILEFNEIAPFIFFVIKGTIQVFAVNQNEQEIELKEHFFHELQHGAHFNYIGGMLSQPSIFRFKAVGKVRISKLFVIEIFRMCRKSEGLKDIVRSMILNHEKQGVVYDFHRLYFPRKILGKANNHQVYQFFDRQLANILERKQVISHADRVRSIMWKFVRGFKEYRQENTFMIEMYEPFQISKKNFEVRKEGLAIREEQLWLQYFQITNRDRPIQGQQDDILSMEDRDFVTEMENFHKLNNKEIEQRMTIRRVPVKSKDSKNSTKNVTQPQNNQLKPSDNPYKDDIQGVAKELRSSLSGFDVLKQDIDQKIDSLKNKLTQMHVVSDTLNSLQVLEDYSITGRRSQVNTMLTDIQKLTKELDNFQNTAFFQMHCVNNKTI